MSTVVGSGSVGITTDDQKGAEDRRSKGEFVRGVSTARHWVVDDDDDDDDDDDAEEEEGVHGLLFPVRSDRYHHHRGVQLSVVSSRPVGTRDPRFGKTISR